MNHPCGSDKCSVNDPADCRNTCGEVLEKMTALANEVERLTVEAERLRGLVWRVWNHDNLTADDVEDAIAAMSVETEKDKA